MGGTRPDWAPPEDWVGFRNEFELPNGAHVVEVARFLYGNNRITWIAIHTRSEDRKYGDRLNYAGLGLWLRNCLIADPDWLLSSLRAIFGEAEVADPARLERVAQTFLGPEHLPTNVAPLMPQDDLVGGWNFSATQSSRTQLFAVDASTPETSWNRAAEQIARMSLIKSTEDHPSRALILLPEPGHWAKSPRAAFKVVKAGLVSELLTELPKALDGLVSRCGYAELQARSVQDRAQAVEAELTALRGERDSLRDRVAGLEQAAAEDPSRRQIEKVECELERVAKRLTRVDDGIDRLNHKVDLLSTRPRDVEVPRLQRGDDWTESASHPVRDFVRSDPVSLHLSDRESARTGFWPSTSIEWTIVGLLAAGIVALAAYLILVLERG